MPWSSARILLMTGKRNLILMYSILRNTGATWVQDVSGGIQTWTGMALADDGVTGVAITYNGFIYGCARKLDCRHRVHWPRPEVRSSIPNVD